MVVCVCVYVCVFVCVFMCVCVCVCVCVCEGCAHVCYALRVFHSSDKNVAAFLEAVQGRWKQVV